MIRLNPISNRDALFADQGPEACVDLVFKVLVRDEKRGSAVEALRFLSARAVLVFKPGAVCRRHGVYPRPQVSDATTSLRVSNHFGKNLKF